MSLWTPDGEVPIERGGPGAGRSEAGAAPGAPREAMGGSQADDATIRSAAAAMGIDPDSLSPAERERLAELVTEMAEAQRRLAAAPAADVIANHAMGLYEFAAIKLGTEPPQLADARTAIDALGGILEASGDRLGDHGRAHAEALDQIRMAWVQVSDAAGGGPDPVPDGGTE
jgi:hypothetical protein